MYSQIYMTLDFVFFKKKKGDGPACFVNGLNFCLYHLIVFFLFPFLIHTPNYAKLVGNNVDLASLSLMLNSHKRYILQELIRCYPLMLKKQRWHLGYGPYGYYCSLLVDVWCVKMKAGSQLILLWSIYASSPSSWTANLMHSCGPRYAVRTKKGHPKKHNFHYEQVEINPPNLYPLPKFPFSTKFSRSDGAKCFAWFI